MAKQKPNGRGIRLTVGADHYSIHPLRPVPGVVIPAEGVSLPQFPLSQLLWLNTLATLFHDRHHRCMTALLMLDAAGHKWVRPELPTQRCSADGVAWNVRPEDLASRPPEVLIGGSYQIAAACTLDEIMSRLPPMDGFHLVNAFSGSERRTVAFLTMGGEPHFAQMETFVVDDWAAVIAAHSDRLQLI